jgi:hypothetical protein
MQTVARLAGSLPDDAQIDNAISGYLHLSASAP